MSLPTVPYNGTAPDGGDIGIALPTRASLGGVLTRGCRNVQYQFVVYDGGCCVGACLHSPGLAHDPRCGLFLLRPRSKKVCPILDMALPHVHICRVHPGPLSPPSPLILAPRELTPKWWLWGYSLTFSKTGGKFIGNFENFALMHVLAQPVVAAPELTYCVFQLMFAAITPALAIGAAAERGRMLPCVVFIFVWATLVYDPIACWTWNPNGWVAQMGGLDFAGGTPVHISSGSAALAYSLMLGKRRGHGTQELNYRPHNVTHVIIGTCFLWFGWFGFNGGSAVGANLRATMACVVTNLAASVGGFTWVLMDYRIEGKWSAIGWCSGAVAGLVAITPGSGFVPAWAAIVFGICAGIACNYTTKLKFILGIDDSLDIFAVHAIGGAVGDLLTYLPRKSI
jgi:ammonium transporter, Amt family